jgi:YVTN family beta-propeller protein
MMLRRPHWALRSSAAPGFVLVFIPLLLIGGLQTGPIHPSAVSPRAGVALAMQSAPLGQGAPASLGRATYGQLSGGQNQAVGGAKTITPRAVSIIRSVTPGLVLSPINGSVGTVVSASGTGFASSVKISLTFDGLDLNSSCMTDSNGTFPGTSGTPCRFVVPPVPGGAEAVVATDAGLPGPSGGIPVGSSADFEAYDSGLGEIFVANGGSGNVSIISDSNDSIVGSVTVQSYPNGLAYDPALGEIFVTNSGSDNVSVIADSNNTVVATIATGSQPYNCAYDSGLGEVFVTNAASDNVSIISTSNDTVVGSVGVGGGPIGIAYDFALGELFVANSASRNVSVIADSNNTVVATVTVGSSPQYVAFVPSRSEVFVTDYSSDNVSVISTTNNSLIATIAVGTNPIGVAYDPAESQVFVANINTDNVSIISDASNSILGTTSNVNSGPYAVVADPTVGEVFVTNVRGTEVNLIPVGSHASANFSINATISFLPRSDLGQIAFVSGAGFGGSLPLVTFELGSSGLTCIIASVGNCVNGTTYTNSSGDFNAKITVPASLAPGTYNLTATDSAGNSADLSISVFADPLVSTPSATPSTVDIGQSTTFNVTVEFGAGPYEFSWRGLPSGCSSTLASFGCAPTSAGGFSLSVVVLDANGFSATSGQLAFTVFLDPVSEAPTALLGVTSGQVDAGQSVTFHESATLGTEVYTSYLWTGLPAGCSGSTENVTCSGTSLPAGNYSVSVVVIDSNNFSSLRSGNLAFAVDSDPAVAPPSANRPSLDLGQAVTFSAVASQGAGPFGYDWVGLPGGCVSSDSASDTCTPSVAGPYSVQVRVTDLNNFAATSTPLAFVVYADPNVEIVANRTSFDVGQGVALIATTEFGSGGETYGWSGLPVGCVVTGSTATCVVSDAGRLSVQVKANDSDGGHATSSSLVLYVAPELVGSFSASNQSVEVGQPVVFQTNVSGGTNPIVDTWSFGDGTTASGVSVNHSYSRPGDYFVVLWINDSSNGSVKRTLAIAVTSPTAGAGSTLPTLDILAVLLIVVVLAAIAGLLLVRRRRRAAPQDEPTSTEPVDDSGTESSGGEVSTAEASDLGVP